MTTRTVVRGGTVHRVGRPAERADLHIVDDTVVDPGPIPADGRTTAVIDASGASVLPLVTRSVVASDGASAADLEPGSRATFAVVRDDARGDILDTFIVPPRSLVALVVDGVVEAQDGRPTREPGDPGAPWVGTWRDARARIAQRLGADGRYSEARDGREHVYTGRYWTRGTRIVYLDDSGFWAHGELRRGVLHHAGFLLRPPGAA